MARKGRGFTLVEMAVVVAIVGILAAVAYPAYLSQTQKARRSDAKTALMDAVSRQEQFILDHGTYTTNMTELGYAADPLVSQDGYYTVDAAAGACGAILTCYTLTATPVAAQPQSKDTQCTSLAVASTGARTATGTLGAGCW
jgi:type IV pilus assembly protein PilE